MRPQKKRETERKKEKENNFGCKMMKEFEKYMWWKYVVLGTKELNDLERAILVER